MTDSAGFSILEAQRAVGAFVLEAGLSVDSTARTLDLAAETGELAKEALEATAYGTRPFDQTAGWADEIGDVLFSLLALAEATGVNLDSALGSTMEKLTARHERSGSLSSRAGAPADPN
jgi:NTP pyrophosphatase (non-canonical NTP hydrolase)